VDAGLLANREQDVLRQIAAVLAMREPDRYADLLERQARDTSRRVRRTLAELLARTTEPLSPALLAVRDRLASDVRNSVRGSLLAPSAPD